MYQEFDRKQDRSIIFCALDIHVEVATVIIDIAVGVIVR